MEVVNVAPLSAVKSLIDTEFIIVLLLLLMLSPLFDFYHRRRLRRDAALWRALRFIEKRSYREKPHENLCGLPNEFTLANSHLLRRFARRI